MKTIKSTGITDTTSPKNLKLWIYLKTDHVQGRIITKMSHFWAIFFASCSSTPSCMKRKKYNRKTKSTMKKRSINELMTTDAMSSLRLHGLSRHTLPTKCVHHKNTYMENTIWYGVRKITATMKMKQRISQTATNSESGTKTLSNRLTQNR